jgi:hypothetical protein
MKATAPLAPLSFVYDGRDCLGFILARGKLGFEAMDRDERITWRFSNAARSGNRNHAGAIMSAPGDFVFGNKKMPGHTNAPGSFNRNNINACITAPEAAQWEF